MHQQMHLVLLDRRGNFHQRGTHDVLAQLRRDAFMMPRSLEVGPQRKISGPFLGRRRRSFSPVLQGLQLRLALSHRHQAALPFPGQVVEHIGVVRIDRVELRLRPVRPVARFGERRLRQPDRRKTRFALMVHRP